MTAFSGSYSGRAQSQSILNVPDVAGHMLDLFLLPAVQKSTDPLWDGAPTVYCGTTDLIGGQGRQTGYFVNTRLNGDQDHGTFEGKVSQNSDKVIVDGTWKSTGGTGKFAQVAANGTFRTTVAASGEAEVVWEGNYTNG